jgi:hypothetical protein
MSMTARCGAAALCRGATTVRVAAHETSGGKVMAVWIAQSTAAAAACETRGNLDRGMSSSAFHTTSQRTPCMHCSIQCTQSAAGSAGATVWIATSFRPRPCVLSTPSHADAAEFSSTLSHAAAAAHALCSFHHSPRVQQLSDSRCSAALRGSTAPGRHGHQTTPR